MRALFDRIEASGRLPTPPVVVVRLLELSDRSELSTNDIVEVVSMDPALVAKVLRFANSPLAGLRSEVTTIEQAVSLLGLRGVSMMALSFVLVSHRQGDLCRGFDHERFGIETFACGVAARTLSEEFHCCVPAEAFVGGLLSQMGRCILASSVPDVYALILDKAVSVPADLPALEQEKLGGTYADVGGQTLRRWGLPEVLCQAIETFRDLGEPAALTPLAKLLKIAETAAAVICAPRDAKPPDDVLFLHALRQCFDTDPEHALSLLPRIAAQIEDVRAVFELPAGHIRSVEDLEAGIRERVAELSVAIHLENQTLAKRQEDLLRRATTDALTTVGNRAAFEERMTLELERASRSGSPFAVLMVDVDLFKGFNDTYGHQAGDYILRGIARSLDDNIRRVDYCARYGGDEFVVIVPFTKRNGVILLAERLHSCVRRLSLSWEGRPLNVTVTVGVGFLASVGEVNESHRHVIKAADRCLYEGKAAGRDCVRAESQAAVSMQVAGGS